MGTPAKCLNFPSGFLVDVLKAWFDDVITTVAICCSTGKPCQRGRSALAMPLFIKNSGWLPRLIFARCFEHPVLCYVNTSMSLAISSFTLACCVLNELAHPKLKAGFLYINLWNIQNSVKEGGCSWLPPPPRASRAVFKISGGGEVGLRK